MENMKSIRPILILAFSLVFMACPPPAMRLYFQSGGVIGRDLIISEDSLKVKFQGYFSPLLTRDYIFMQFAFEGFTISETTFCDKNISFESNGFYSCKACTSIVAEKSGNTCVVNLWYDHKDIQTMTKSEIKDYIDSLRLSFEIDGVFREKRRVEVIFDKEWIIKRFMAYGK